MKIDINELEEVVASKGGSKHPKCTLNRGGYIVFNNAFIKEKEMDRSKSLNLRAAKKEDKLIVAAIFFDREDEGSFKLNSNKAGRMWFSGRNLFSQFGIKYEALVSKRQRLILKPYFQYIDGKNYLIIEIPLPKKILF